MKELLLLFGVAAANFLFIGLKSFQQRNVAFDNFKLILPTSMLMAIVEVYVIATVARAGFSLDMAVALGLGGGSGSVVATWVHGRHVLKQREVI